MQTSIFSVDVEDWFHILDVPSAPELAEWSGLPSRVEKNFSKLLELFSEENVQVTCFFLGWIGERFPHLVKEAAARGHEIASHGYGHRLVYQQSRNDFHDDVRHARLLLEDIAGVPVTGYRAPGFSTTNETPWFFDALAEAGYQYDSSVFPAARGHGGMRNGRREPHRVGDGEGILEVPITVAYFDGQAHVLFRRRLSAAVSLLAGSQDGAPGAGRGSAGGVLHSPARNRSRASALAHESQARNSRSYVNLERTERKVRRIFRDFPVTTFQNVISNYPELVNSHVA